MTGPDFALSWARTDDDLAAAQRLRYDVFVDELGGDGPLVDHAERREADRYDDAYEHLILKDISRPPDDRVVGTYRMVRGDGLGCHGRFYAEEEYDLAPLRRSGRRLLELGRSCIHRDYRGGTAMLHLWAGVAEYVRSHGIEVLFGVASFHGICRRSLAEPLSILHHRHLAPPELRVRARPPNAVDINMLPLAEIDRARATRAIPALIKGYLRLGGFVGEGAYVDRAFNTTDVCLVLDAAQLKDQRRRRYLHDLA